MSMEEAIQRAIYSQLTTHLPSTLIVDHVIQPDDTGKQRFPYIAIGDANLSAWDTDNTLGADIDVTLHIWSRQRGGREVKELQGQIYSALHRQQFPVTGYHLVTIDLMSTEIYLESDGVTRHGLSRFRILLDE